MTTKHKKTPELKVVFDSNAIYTGSASDLLSNDATQIIKEHSTHSDLKVTWYLPDIVVYERQYQMMKKGQDLLPSIQKLEKLLCHNLNITESIIETSVREVVDSQIDKFNIQVFHLAVDKVDWNKIINDSAYRHPPFESGEKEKGFRDALIAETFMQIVSTSPSTPNICRIVLVTGDTLLGEAVKARTNSYTNVRLASTQEELKSLINTLIADISEEYVANIQEMASKYFFIPNDESTFYYRDKIRDQIRQKYSSELDLLPKGSNRRENGTWYVSSPRFVQKVGQRVRWISQIRIETKAFAKESYLRDIVSNQFLLKSDQPEACTGLLSGSILPAEIGVPSKSYLSNLVSSPTFLGAENLVASGKSIFEITWSVSVSITKKFNNPRVEKITFIETIWE